MFLSSAVSDEKRYHVLGVTVVDAITVFLLVDEEIKVPDLLYQEITASTETVLVPADKACAYPVNEYTVPASTGIPIVVTFPDITTGIELLPDNAANPIPLTGNVVSDFQAKLGAASFTIERIYLNSGCSNVF
jgi:hypothetical protein